MMMELFKKLFNCRLFVFGSIIGISIVALAGALVGQFVFDLPPCHLCILQRIPFVAVIILGLIGLFWARSRLVMMSLSAVAFFVNSGIALYHTGIERNWWSESSGCAVNFDFEQSAQSLMEQITSAQVESCATIPWADPILGLSMANYNVLLCALMGIFCVIGLSNQLQEKHNR
jgi:disulfide bond formation protein DsbB